jgi:hypothetical protein
MKSVKERFASFVEKWSRDAVLRPKRKHEPAEWIDRCTPEEKKLMRGLRSEDVEDSVLRQIVESF